MFVTLVSPHRLNEKRRHWLKANREKNDLKNEPFRRSPGPKCNKMKRMVST
jgi:hypothetical protein